jgi:4-hydroxy-tetrahydrodipicolinate synthase
LFESGVNSMTIADANAWLAGYIPDLPTPFDEKGAVDLAALARLCERQIGAHAPAIIVCETAGEASCLSPEERDRVIRTAVETARGRAPVIAGAGSNDTGRAIELTQRAEAAGAAAVLSVVPYYNKPMQAGIEAHFRAVADATALPVILHDIPSRTIREITDDTLVRLAESGRFSGLRDSSGDVARILRVRPRLGAGFRLLSGDDTTALAFLACGGDGCISQVANVAPDLCRDIFANCRRGRLQSARYLQKRILRLAAELSNESPATLKYALSLLGLMRPHTRLPVTELDSPARHRMTSVMADMAEEDLADVVPV